MTDDEAPGHADGHPGAPRLHRPGEVVADLLVFAPIGLAVEAVRLAQRRRAEIEEQVEQARALGSFVVPFVRKHGWSMARSMLTNRPRTGSGSSGGAER